MTHSSDKFITHSSSLEKANKIRIKLLHYDPHPCVYVYQTDYKNPSKGYDVHVSNGFGLFPSDELFATLVDHIKDMVEPQSELESETVKIETNKEEEEKLLS